MRKRIISIICLSLMIFPTLLACGKEKAKGDVYIPVYQLFAYKGFGEINYNGNDYINAEKHQDEIAKELGDSYNHSYHNELILNHFDNVIWMDDGKFAMFSSELVDGEDFGRNEITLLIDEVFYGEYEKTRENRLNFSYSTAASRDSMYNSFDYINVDSEPKNTGYQELVSRMNDANKYNGFINGQFYTYIEGINGFLSMSFKPSLAGLPVYTIKNGNELLQDNKQFSYNTISNIYYFDNYIVAQQKGLSFESIKSNDEFSLKFEMPSNATYYSSKDVISDSGITGHHLYEDNVTQWNGIINFNNNGSFDAIYEDSTVNGTWYLFDNHILIMDTTENANIQFMAILYVDFENETIFVPGYVKCNKILEYMDMSLTEEISE